MFLHSTFSSSHPDSFSVDTRPSTFVVWLKPRVSRLICIVVSVTSRFVKASAGSQWLPTSETRSENSTQSRHIGLIISVIVSTQLPPSSALAVRTESLNRTSTVTSDIDQTDINSQW